MAGADGAWPAAVTAVFLLPGVGMLAAEGRVSSRMDVSGTNSASRESTLHSDVTRSHTTYNVVVVCYQMLKNSSTNSNLNIDLSHHILIITQNKCKTKTLIIPKHIQTIYKMVIMFYSKWSVICIVVYVKIITCKFLINHFN